MSPVTLAQLRHVPPSCLPVGNSIDRAVPLFFFRRIYKMFGIIVQGEVTGDPTCDRTSSALHIPIVNRTDVLLPQGDVSDKFFQRLKSPFFGVVNSSRRQAYSRY